MWEAAELRLRSGFRPRPPVAVRGERGAGGERAGVLPLLLALAGQPAGRRRSLLQRDADPPPLGSDRPPLRGQVGAALRARAGPGAELLDCELEPCGCRAQEDVVVLGVHDLRFSSQTIPVDQVFNQPHDGSFPPKSDLSLLRLSVPARLSKTPFGTPPRFLL